MRTWIVLTTMILVLSTVGCKKAGTSDEKAAESESTVDQKKNPYGVDQPGTPKIMNLGIEFGRYNNETGKAGDIVFFESEFFPKVFREFGIIVEGPNQSHKRLPEFD